MKKNYIFLTLVLTSFLGFGQVFNDFNNGGGDLLWSNPANWTLGELPNVTNTDAVRLPLLVESSVDTDFTIKKIQIPFGLAGDVSVAGNATLIIDAGTNNGFGIENSSNNDVNMTFKGNVTINNSTADGISNTWIRNGNGAGNLITFADGSLLTLSTPLDLRLGAGPNFNFNGALAGTAALRFGPNITSTFGSTSDNSGFGGDIVFVGTNGTLVVNTADNSIFLPNGRKFQINQTPVSAEVNGANVIQGNIVVGGSNSFTFDVNKNQNAMGTIAFAGGTSNGTLNLDIDDSVTELFFANSSEVGWGSGTLNITGFKEGVIKFGTDNTGLTTAQLAQITADGVGSGQTLALETDGTLILASSLGIEDYDYQNKGRLSFPAVISDQNLQIKVPITSYKIFNTLGQKVQSFSNKSEFQEINVSNLKAGIYILSIEGKVSERFIKQ